MYWFESSLNIHRSRQVLDWQVLFRLCLIKTIGKEDFTCGHTNTGNVERSGRPKEKKGRNLEPPLPCRVNCAVSWVGRSRLTAPWAAKNVTVNWQVYGIGIMEILFIDYLEKYQPINNDRYDFFCRRLCTKYLFIIILVKKWCLI